eukprot:gnl/TRDRNA2_/TRDRNA2_186849_c0_seq1.p1 gnl/TRDRNA2_/TRDRNA2_186849_c0~~gnl/TRDRNA2_/TRDRNA2_186849_c0_seq1.p1  ORF type:complete len:393 (+),score=94.54 gnl/TRDRNA2_/TRDRNA2_186849_c0_seq1:77-1180(+)
MADEAVDGSPPVDSAPEAPASQEANGTAATASPAKEAAPLEATAAASPPSMEEVTKLKECLDGFATGPREGLLEALTKLKMFGQLPTKVFSDTKVGLTVNKVSKEATDEAVKASAKELVDHWRQAHRKRKASGNLSRNNSTASLDASPLGTDQAALSQDSFGLSRVDSVAAAEAPVERKMSAEEEAKAKKREEQRGKVRQKLLECLGKEEEIEVKGEDEEMTEQMRDPVALANEMEEALNEQLPEEKDYLNQARSILFNLKDTKNLDFRFKLMVGVFKPEHVPKLTPEDMASDERNQARNKLKAEAMAEIESDWAMRHGGVNITGMFTCGKCKGTKTTYFQMQTRSSDEPMTTFARCLTCGNRWKFC